MQVNVLDPEAGQVAFGRVPMAIMPAANVAQPVSITPPGKAGGR
jgi:hypothetical protein